MNPDSRPAQAVLESERQFFDGLVGEQGDFNPFSERGWQTLERRFLEMTGAAPNARMLDIGCGTGQSRQIYIKHVGHYTGADLSPASIAAARRRFPQEAWMVADACRLPLGDESCDIVAFSSVLHHIPDFPAAVREAVRVLRPGGRVFAFDPNLLHPAMALFRHSASPLYSPKGVSPNERPLLATALRRAFSAAGLTCIRQRGQSNIPYRAVAIKSLNAVLAAYNLVDRLWDWSGMGLFFGTFVLTAGEKKRGNGAWRLST